MYSITDGVPLEQLLLDPKNPRLPDELIDQSQEEILTYLYDNDVLEELAESLNQNGYFENEPLIVLPADDKGQRIVAEGNRRLATLLILNQSPAAIEAGLQFDLTSQTTAKDINTDHIPAFEVEDRRELAAYLGFRHINGIRTWGAYEKARYVSDRVLEAEADGQDAPFTSVGRLVGGNARGVRNSFTAFCILNLEDVRDEVPDAVRYVARHRFAVFLKLLGTKHIPDYIGFNKDARSLKAVVESIQNTETDRVVEVLRDLAPDSGGLPPLVTDSRLATVYADVLVNPEAKKVLRSTRNLTFAVSILQQGNLESRIDQANRLLISLKTLVEEADNISSEALEGIDRLFKNSRAIVGVSNQVAAGQLGD